MSNTLGARLLKFGLALSAVALVWGCLLPALANVPAIRDHIESHERLGIDGSAKFYSEHPRAIEVQSRMSDSMRTHQDAFWSIRPAKPSSSSASE